MSGTSATITAHPDLDTGIKSCAERMLGERAQRVADADKVRPFGVSFLDDALGGIHPKDLIVIGASTGFGKTQLATLISKENAKRGGRVLYMALEAEENEIERRIRYQHIADEFFRSSSRPNVHLNYMDWAYGRLDRELDEIERKVGAVGELYPGLHTMYKGDNFDVQAFKRIFISQKDNYDFFVVDHLHYFDSEDPNENRAVKEIMLAIRNCVLISGKPVVLISHIRKIDRRMKQLVPAMEDLHGSSEISKIATKVIMLAPVPGQILDMKRETYCEVQKVRVDGARMFFTGRMAFDIRMQSYSSDYFLGRMSPDRQEFILSDPMNLPKWAANAAGRLR